MLAVLRALILSLGIDHFILPNRREWHDSRVSHVTGLNRRKCFGKFTQHTSYT